jgi:FKBP-type peptidyl-prolyl cis-trans isomerase FklB
MATCSNFMKYIYLAAMMVLATSWSLRAGDTNNFNTEKERVGYAMGVMLSSGWKDQFPHVDAQAIARGIDDVQSGKATMTMAQARTIVIDYRNELVARVAITNKLEGAAFLAANAKKAGIVTLPDGLQYKIITEGTGSTPTPNDVVTVNYSGRFIDGKQFDQSPPGQPIKLSLQGVIRAWTEALPRMKVGAKWQLFVPSDLAYGENGQRGIPPNSTLIFDIELLATEPLRAAAPLTSDIVRVPSDEERKKGVQVETIKAEDVAKMQSQVNTNHH